MLKFVVWCSLVWTIIFALLGILFGLITREAEAVLALSGFGLEITLKHVADPLRAADHCCLFRQIVKRLARKHGCAATFLGKPFLDQTGSGMHVHMSLLDRDGNNVFKQLLAER